jgi:hypothetical protein
MGTAWTAGPPPGEVTVACIPPLECSACWDSSLWLTQLQCSPTLGPHPNTDTQACPRCTEAYHHVLSSNPYHKVTIQACNLQVCPLPLDTTWHWLLCCGGCKSNCHVAACSFVHCAHDPDRQRCASADEHESMHLTVVSIRRFSGQRCSVAIHEFHHAVQHLAGDSTEVRCSGHHSAANTAIALRAAAGIGTPRTWRLSVLGRARSPPSLTGMPTTKPSTPSCRPSPKMAFAAAPIPPLLLMTCAAAATKQAHTPLRRCTSG